MCACSWGSEAAVFIAVDEDVTQIIVQTELQETIARACDGPTVLFMMLHDQAMIFGAVTKSAIVVGASTGAVLNTQNVIMIMYHLMQQCGTDFFNGTSKGTGSNVDLMGGTFLLIHVSSRKEKWPYARGVLCMVIVGFASTDSKNSWFIRSKIRFR